MNDDKKLELVLKSNKPLRVYGDFILVREDKTEILVRGGEKISFCRCGNSSNKPFCDGTHTKLPDFEV